MSVYVGVAEAACELARGIARRKSATGLDPHLPYLIGEMHNTLVTAQLAAQDMVSQCEDYAFEPTVQTANSVLIRKTITANACIEAVGKALEVGGGATFLRGACCAMCTAAISIHCSRSGSTFSPAVSPWEWTPSASDHRTRRSYQVE
jgi:alkylation response protein AidB-like acyl-CoA dehydrogenase